MKKYIIPQTKMIIVAPASMIASTTINTQGPVKSGDASSMAASRQSASWADYDE